MSLVKDEERVETQDDGRSRDYYLTAALPVRTSPSAFADDSLVALALLWLDTSSSVV